MEHRHRRCALPGADRACGRDGRNHPRFDYKAELDLCDCGQVKVTDVWAGVNFGKGWRVQLGQMRMPFTFGSARGPQSYLFANRPFTDKQFIGPRNAGVKGVYACPKMPLRIEGGVFNSSSKENHAWQKRLAYATKALWSGDLFTFIAGFESLAPGTVRINHANAGVTFHSGRWMAEAEYVYKHYTHNAFSEAHAYNFMADYSIPLKWTDMQRLSFQARYDGMTDNWNGTTYTDDGKPALTDAARSRLTLGSTISAKYGPVWVDFKLNYQQVFMQHNAAQTANTGNMATAELVLHF